MAVVFPEWLIQSRIHKWIREAVLRASLDAALSVLVALLSTGITLYFTIRILPPEDQRIGWGLLAMLLGVVGVKAVVHFRAARDAERLRRDVMCALLRLLHRRVFHGSPDFRLTLFILDPVAKVVVRREDQEPFSERILVPFLRRQAGREYDPPTRTYYPLSCGAASAKAWNIATRSRADLQRGDLGSYLIELPRFGSRLEMELYYRESIGVLRAVARRISNYMVEVVQILSFPLVDERGDPMYLLSVDSKVNFLNDDPNGRAIGVAGVVRIDVAVLGAYLEGVRHLLATVRHSHD